MIGLLWATALVLAGAGVAKLVKPGPTTIAAGDAGIVGSALLTNRRVVRLLGLIEIGIATAVVILGGAWSAALLALAYLALALVAWRLIRDAPGKDCGCFGRASEPVGRPHLVVDGTAAAIGAFAVLWPPAPLPVAWAQDPGSTILLVASALVLSWLAYLSMTAFPALSRARGALAGGAA